MRKASLALVLALFMASVGLLSPPVQAAWEGTHLFSLAVQGSVTSMDQLTSESHASPVEFRATISVTVDPPGPTGDHSGRLRISDAYVHQDGEVVPLPVSSAGYRIVLRTEGAHQVLDNVAGLSAYGIDLNEILTMLFPVPPSQTLAEGASWGTEYTQSVYVEPHTLSMPMRSTFTVNEVRSSLVVVQSSLRGSASQDLNPGRLTSEHLGTGFLHLDPNTGQLIRSAVTVRYTVERTIPLGATVPQERSLLRALITTSVERLDTEPISIPSLGAEYVDPAGRFTVRLPEGLNDMPIHVDHALTLFSNNDQTRLLYVDIAPAGAVQQPSDIAESMLDQYGRFLVDFEVVTQPVEYNLGDRSATLAEYRYTDEIPMFESSLYTQIDGYNVALQYAVAVGNEPINTLRVLELVAEYFDFGPTPEGRVEAEQLIMTPTVLYESEALAFELEVPMLWPPVETGEDSLAFVEIGGAGRVTVHIESVTPGESAITLLSEWLSRLIASGSGITVITPAQQDALGPLSAASAVVEWDAGGHAVRQKVVVANWDGILYVVTVEYDAAGFDARAAIFERILSGFWPRPDIVMMHLNTFHAYDPPPAPEGDAPFLMIGRILHEYLVDGQFIAESASDVRIDLSVDGHIYTAIADSDGFFYAANLPVESGDEIHIDAIRGALFNLPYEVNVPLSGLALSVISQVGFVGELTFTYDGEGISLGFDTGFDPESGSSRVHQAFLNRYPDSPWSELVRADREWRTGS